MARSELLERYQAIPLPTKSDEHWRFTDLAGFDPDSYTAAATRTPLAPATMLEIDASGVASVGEAGITIDHAPDGHPLRAPDRRPSAARHPRRSRREVRRPQRGDVGARAARPRAEGRRAREADLHPDRERGRGRLAVLAAADRGRGAEPLHRDRGVRLRVAGALRLLQRGGRDRRRGGRQGRVRLGPEPLAEHVALRLPPRHGRPRRRARLGRGRLRLGRRQGVDPERPRRARARPRA